MRKTVASLVPAFLCLAMTACSVVSAFSPQAYLDSVGLKSIDLAAVTPGAYTGDYTLALPPDVFAKNRHFNVTVTITGALDVAITVNEPASLSSWNASATEEANNNLRALLGRIEAAMAIPVDGTSGATYTSMALMKAVEKAVAP